MSCEVFIGRNERKGGGGVPHGCYDTDDVQ
jgi:hypothetical protein